METIRTVGELVDYLAKFDRNEKVELVGHCDGGCCYHSAKIIVGCDTAVEQNHKDEYIKGMR